MGWPLAQQPSGLEPRLQRYCSGSSAICGAMCGDVKWGANERSILNPNLPNSQTKSSAAVAHILGSCRWRWIKNGWQLLMKLWQNTRPCDILLHSIVQNLCVCVSLRVCVDGNPPDTSRGSAERCRCWSYWQHHKCHSLWKCCKCRKWNWWPSSPARDSSPQGRAMCTWKAFSIINHHLPFRPFSWLARAFVFACFVSVCIT